MEWGVRGKRERVLWKARRRKAMWELRRLGVMPVYATETEFSGKERTAWVHTMRPTLAVDSFGDE
jgi:hypothetical protein